MVTVADPRPRPQATRTHLTEIVVPIYNEEAVIAGSVRTLHAYLTERFPFPFLITVADNGSTDASAEIVAGLAEELPHVRGVRIDRKGRGRALRHVWSTSTAEVVAYMDADLSIDLDGFLPLVAPLLSGHSDLAIGTRHAPGSSVQRSFKRAVLSRIYNFLLRVLLGARFTDAQCGFKAGRREVVQPLLGVVDDDKWFFDTELLLVAQRHGLRIHEIPIDCLDDPNSSVDLVRTAWDDLRGMARVARRIVSGALHVPLPPHLQRARLPLEMAHQLARFVAVGALCGITHVLLYLWFRTFMPALGANALGLFLTAVLNTAANRRYTFGLRGREDALRHQLEGGVAFLLSLGLSSASLLLLMVLGSGSTPAVELVVLLAGDALAALVRFLMLRHWVFSPARAARRREGLLAARP